MQRFFDKLKGLDMFGHPISLTYNGETSFNTLLGSVLTLGVYTVTLSYLFIRVQSLLDMSDPEVLIMRKSLLESQKPTFLPVNLAQDYRFNFGLQTVDS